MKEKSKESNNRKVAIEYLEKIQKDYTEKTDIGELPAPEWYALDFAISDMKRVEQLEAYFGDKTIAESILTNDKEFTAWLERIKFHVKKADEYARKCETLEAENEKLKKLITDQNELFNDNYEYIASLENTVTRLKEDTVKAKAEIEQLSHEAEMDEANEDWIAGACKAYSKSLDTISRCLGE